MDRNINIEDIQEQKKTAQADSVKAISQAEDWKESYEAVNIKKQELEKQLAELKNQQKEELIKHIDTLSDKIDKIKIPENKGQSNEQMAQLKVQIRKLEQDKADLQSLLQDKTELKRRFKQNEYWHYSKITAFLLTVLLFLKAPIRADWIKTWTYIKRTFYWGIYEHLAKPDTGSILSFVLHWVLPAIVSIVLIVVILALLDKLHRDFGRVYEAEEKAKKVHAYSLYSIFTIIVMLLNHFLAWNIIIMELIAITTDLIYITYQVKINTED